MVNRDRKTYLDILRIVAVFFVIYAHSSATGSKVYQYSNNTFEIWGGLFLECLRCCNNWIFMMISGALLLGKNETIKTIFSHRVLRMGEALLVFSVFYVIVDHRFVGINQFLVDVIHGNIRGEFWFIYSYIGYLLILPILRTIAQHISNAQMKYIIFVFIIFNFLFSQLYAFTNLPSIGVPFLLGGFLIYPLIGYYLSNHNQSNKEILVWGILSCLGLILCSISTYYQYLDTGEWSENYIYRSESVCSIFLFCLVKKLIGGTSIPLWSIISSTAFGIYFLAPFLQKNLMPIYDFIIRYVPVIPSNIIYIVCVMISGIIITLILKKIPIIKKVL